MNWLMRGRRIALAPTICACAVGASLVLGGGGTVNPATEMLLELFVALLAIVWLLTVRDRRVPGSILMLVVLVLALPTLQLVPLPPSIWQSLPGREQATAALALGANEQAWMPWTLVPAATFSSLLSLAPPLIVMCMAAQLDMAERRTILGVTFWVIAAGTLLGVAQLAGGRAFYFYGYSHFGWLTGFQANRNAQVDVLVIGIIAFAAAGFGASQTRSTRLAIAIAGTGFLTMAAIFTGSRAGIAILGAVLIPVVLLQMRQSGFAGRHIRVVLGSMIVLAPVLIFLALRIPAIGRIAGRFESGPDFRRELWIDGWTAATTYWPAGGGIGGFVQLFLPFERLEVIDPTTPNRAHNDYLEWLIEAGLPGVVVLIAALAIVVWMIVRAWRHDTSDGHRKKQASRLIWFFSVASMAVIAVHSILDYPLRSMSIAVLMALAVGMLARPSLSDLREGSRS